jgi:type I restriction enzyme S subunit
MTVTRTVLLGDVCKQDRATVKTGERADLRYIGLESIEANTGRFNEGELSKTPEAPQANSFRFGAKHVLYGKLRPYLNKVALADFEGKCSTEIIPLLPNAELDRRYLGYFLRSPMTVSRISEKTAGARMPRADMDFIFGLKINLPSLGEQLRNVDILSRAEGIVRLRREAEKKAAELIPALFLDMFGDPAANPKGWQMETVGDVIESADYGSSTKASEDGSGLPIIRMGNVDYAGTLNLADLKFVNLTDSEAEKYRLRDGDILFNRTNSKELVGKTGLWGNERDAVVASYFIRLRVDRNKLHPSYLWAFMNSRHMKRILFDTARGAIGQANINSKEIKAFPVAVPPLHLQQKYAARLEDIRAIQSQQAAATATAQATFDALLAQTFVTVTT